MTGQPPPPPRTCTPWRLTPGHIPPGHLPPGHIPPYTLTPWTFTPWTYTPNNLKCTSKTFILQQLHLSVKMTHICCEEGFSPHNCSGSRWAFWWGVGGGNLCPFQMSILINTFVASHNKFQMRIEKGPMT